MSGGNETKEAAVNQVVSVRQKVIEELHTVQQRVSHDARADIALAYCLKMIVSN
jgi:hypothetical protein